jgi:hypothetical protein
MKIRTDRLRVVVIVLCLVGIAAAVVNRKVGVILLAALLAIFVAVGIVQWLTAAPDEDDEDAFGQ